MSNILDKDGKVINAPGYGTTNSKGECRYKNADITEIDWFDTHPRPVEVKPVVAAPVEAKVPVVEKAAEPKPLVEILATEKGTLTFTNPEGTRIQATTPLVALPAPAKVAPAVVAKAVVNETAPSGSDVPQV